MKTCLLLLPFSILIVASCAPGIEQARAGRAVMSDRELHYRGNDRIDTIQEAQTRSVVRADEHQAVMHPLQITNDVIGGLGSLRNNISLLTR